ncbi:MAG: SigB/SigF/SigG family RNA polymerase sigma factor [Clostridia bacterium]|nr:SigB/SigF/SigG family RNA polymerase sigma factor [Clostridia bacterium]MCI8961749.1 SigB/SigF/SigG family RNA polymerase sigma factor [Clostridia bacterium]
MTKLVKDNQGLIWSIVKRFTGRNYETEDLYQIGCMGFIKAIKRFDTSFEVQISTYAVPYILGEIKKFIRDDGIIKVSRSVKELGIKIKQLQSEYLKKNHEEINIAQISKELKVDKEEIIFAMEAQRPVESIYQDENNDNNDKRELISKIPVETNQELKIINNMALKQVIGNLNAREKQIIILRFYKDKTQTEVGKLLGISQVQVSRMEKSVLEKMKQRLEA